MRERKTVWQRGKGKSWSRGASLKPNASLNALSVLSCDRLVDGGREEVTSHEIEVEGSAGSKN